jgi:putative polymerase
LPFILISASVVVPYFHPDAGADDFTGRVAYTLDMLGQFTLQDLLGYSDRFLQGAVDSGVAYLIITQSLIGAALIWLFIACVSTQRSLEQIRFTHSVLLYMALAMTVSYSMLTIKTAALTWFIHGVIQQQGSKQKSAAEGRREA